MNFIYSCAAVWPNSVWIVSNRYKWQTIFTALDNDNDYSTAGSTSSIVASKKTSSIAKIFSFVSSLCFALKMFWNRVEKQMRLLFHNSSCNKLCSFSFIKFLCSRLGCQRSRSRAFLWNGTGTQLILRFLTFFKHIKPCIDVCLSSYAKVVLVPRYWEQERGTHLASHVSRSRTGPRYLYHVPSFKEWKFKSRSPFLGTGTLHPYSRSSSRQDAIGNE